MEATNPARQTIIALDLETTGTDPTKARIVEICLAHLTPDLQVERSWRTLVNPAVPIPEAATAVHGIDNGDVIDAPTFKEVARRIQSLLGPDPIVVAYNGVRFDVPLLHRELEDAGQPGFSAGVKIIDPLHLFMQDQPRTLSAAVQYYIGRPHVGAHAAEEDVKAMVDVLRVQRARRGAPDLRTLAENKGKRYLTIGRQYYQDEDDDTVRLGFGKHCGQPAAEHPGYLRWMMGLPLGKDARMLTHALLTSREVKA